ncbi:tetratricopeptide repeat protein [candidate division KSB1 bacterium]|nr:tetratricopeptide repeat protein [candidate division KSB1 bacterium]
MNAASCTDTAIGCHIWRYELGDLKPDERERFEVHLMECEVCRHEVFTMLPAMGALRQRRVELLARLQDEGVTYEAICSEIRAIAVSDSNRKSPYSAWWSRQVQWLSQWRRSWVLAPAIGAAAIVAILVLMWSYPRKAYLGLLEFEPLLYERHGVREMEAPKPGDFFSEGMDAYCTGDYERAATLLSQAVTHDSENDSAWLYLGVSYYLQEDAGPALKALRQATSSTSPGVRNAGQWYLAQAFLLNNQADSALEVLEQVDRESRWSPRADLLATKLWKLKGTR